MLRLIKREALNIVHELFKLSAHNLGSSSGFDAKYPVSASASCLPWFFSRSAGRGGSMVLFCGCFVLFERPVKLRAEG